MKCRITFVSSLLAIAAGFGCSPSSSGSMGQTAMLGATGASVAPPSVVGTQPPTTVNPTPAASAAPGGPAAPAPSNVQTGTGIAGGPAAAPAAMMHMMMSAAANGAAGKPPAPPVGGAAGAPAAGSGGGTPADAFCDKYGMYCKYGMPNRHADRAACMADFNASPNQQACKNMHMDTAIAGTAAACNGMQSDFCFSIHCLHVAGIVDPTGVTYCKD